MAGEILRDGYGTQFTISSKRGKHDLVTEYDKRSEQRIIEFLSLNVPGSHFLAEESGISGPKDGEILWIIDPLDGTTNFARHIPMFSISIAAEKNGEVISGIIYQPITHELFVAEKGKGAYLNGKPIHVSETPAIDQAILATGFPYNLAENPFHCIDHFIDILKIGIPIRRIGSAAIDLSYTAAGRFEGFFEAELGAWDVAAGKLLVEEAGGRVTHWDGKPFQIRSRTPILATNGHIHQRASSVLSRAIQ